MSVYSRVFLNCFAGYFVWCFLLVQVLLGSWTTLLFVSRNLQVSLSRIARAIPDFVLAYFWASVAVAVLLAGFLYFRRIQRSDAVLRILLCGRSPGRFQWPVLLFAGFLSLASWWCEAFVAPKVKFHSRYLLASALDDPSDMAVRLLRHPTLLGGLVVQFRCREGKSLIDFCMRSRGKGDNLAVSAARARFSTDETGRLLILTLSRGRLLSVDGAGRLGRNLRFDELRLEFDAAALSIPSKTQILSPEYYTNQELRLLDTQAILAGRHGVTLTTKKQRRVAAVDSVMWSRLQAALMPLLFMGVAVVWLGTVVRPARKRELFVMALCLGVLLPQEIFLDGQAKAGSIDTPFISFLPTLEVAGVIGLWALRNLAKRTGLPRGCR